MQIATPKFGVLVSGGIDSTSILCIAEMLHKQDSIRYPKPIGIHFAFEKLASANERAFVESIQRLYGTDIEFIPSDDCWCFRNFTEIPFTIGEEPNNITALFFLHRQGLKHAKVRGIETLFWGDFAEELVWPYWWFLPDLLRTLSIKELTLGLKNVSEVYHRKFLSALWKLTFKPLFYATLDKSPPLLRHTPSWITENLKERINEKKSLKFFSYDRIFKNIGHQRRFEDILNLQTAIQRTKKVSSLENLYFQSPFIDKHLTEFALNVPHTFRFGEFEKKTLLISAVKDILPREVLQQSRGCLHSLFYIGIQKEYKNLTALIDKARRKDLPWINWQRFQNVIDEYNNQRHPENDIQVIRALQLTKWLVEIL